MKYAVYRCYGCNNDTFVNTEEDRTVNFFHCNNCLGRLRFVGTIVGFDLALDPNLEKKTLKSESDFWRRD